MPCVSPQAQKTSTASKLAIKANTASKRRITSIASTASKHKKLYPGTNIVSNRSSRNYIQQSSKAIQWAVSYRVLDILTYTQYTQNIYIYVHILRESKKERDNAGHA